MTIGQLEPSGIDGLLVFCDGRNCGHLAEVELGVAKARWGDNLSLSDIKGVCTVCGGREIDVRPRWPAVGPGGFRVDR